MLQLLEASKKRDAVNIFLGNYSCRVLLDHSETRVRFGERWVSERPDAQAVFEV